MALQAPLTVCRASLARLEPLQDLQVLNVKNVQAGRFQQQQVQVFVRHGKSSSLILVSICLFLL